ncbi:uncharacterized protein LOC106181837 [Lingula anatina]|uniref:Uncharacterized protein LOC106181837 n=1 Tax=Lingula anatina TaxID=7574 RepID=A0A2R2MIE0_LINAN|nr:uncharacterized protein LOC106181837 [Lingula anatina]|eukprot:XP_023929991.1 uncharacterized protein LOC106181837 [Lingula anatina]
MYTSFHQPASHPKSAYSQNKNGQFFNKGKRPFLGWNSYNARQKTQKRPGTVSNFQEETIPKETILNFDAESVAENSKGPGRCADHCTFMANTALVSSSASSVVHGASVVATYKEDTQPATPGRTSTFTSKQTKTDSMQIVRKCMQEAGISGKAQDIVKQSRPSKNQPVIPVNFFADDSQICVLSALAEYLDRTRLLRHSGCSQLFISYTRPYAPVSKATISRWIKAVMFKAGMDVNIFKSHSTRAASTSFCS